MIKNNTFVFVKHVDFDSNPSIVTIGVDLQKDTVRDVVERTRALFVRYNRVTGIVFGGMFLKLDSKLADYGIQHESTCFTVIN
jgi:hypothetical protein